MWHVKFGHRFVIYNFSNMCKFAWNINLISNYYALYCNEYIENICSSRILYNEIHKIISYYIYNISILKFQRKYMLSESFGIQRENH